jgi:uncharacterized membrane protein
LIAKLALTVLWLTAARSVFLSAIYGTILASVSYLRGISFGFMLLNHLFLKYLFGCLLFASFRLNCSI